MRFIKGRRVVLAVVLSIAFAGFATSSASAYEQWYCGGNVSAGYECQSRGLHSLYYNLSIALLTNVRVGEYMWNTNNRVIRGGHIGYGVWFAERTWNRTGDQWYNARAFNNDLATNWLDGYTKA